MTTVNMLLIHKFNLSTIAMLVVFTIGISQVCGDKFEDRAIKANEQTYAPQPDNALPVRQILELIRSKFVTGQVGARTFGQIKKFQTALLPIMYKLGVISTIIMITLFLAMKGVFIGTIILIMNVAFFAAKIGGLFDKGHHSHGWSQSHSNSYLPKDVHLHIHNGAKPAQYVPYSAAPVWESTGQGWGSYGPTQSTGRYLGDVEVAQPAFNGKADTEPFQIIYPAENKASSSIVRRSIKDRRYRMKSKT